MHWSKYTGHIKIDDDQYLIFHNISCQMDLVTAEHVGDAGSLEPDVADYFAVRGYLTEKSVEEEETDYLRSVTEGFRRSQKRKKHVLVMTYDCNLRCTYCFEKTLRARGQAWMKKVMNREMIDRFYAVVDHFDEQGDDREEPILLFGGEPFLPEHRGIIEYIVEQGTRRGRQFSAVTNGTTLDQYHDLLTQYPFQSIQVTLDGVRSVHDQRRFFKGGEGTFDLIVRNLQKTAEIKNLSILIKIAVDQENLPYLPELSAYLRALDLHNRENVRAFLSPVFGGTPEENHKYNREESLRNIIHFPEYAKKELIWSGGLDHYHPLEQMFKSGVWPVRYSYCRAHQGMLFYDPFGMIYPCWETVGKEAMAIGTYAPVLEFNSLYERWMNRHVASMEKCRSCKYALLCGGGCAYTAHQSTGRLEEPNCGEMEVFFKEYIPYIRHRYVSQLSKEILK